MSLDTLTDKQLRDTDWELVVIGQGYAAIVNCVTRFRTGTLPKASLMIGLPDPWQRYADHPMGQYPPLLALPGYDEDAQPDRADRLKQSQFLSSTRFAELNQLQLSRLLSGHGILTSDGIVESPLSFVGGRWMISARRGLTTVTLKAKKVDICTGPGPGRVFSPGGERVYGPWADGIRDSFDAQLLQELIDGVGERAMIADQFMALRKVNGTVLIVGEGPLAASVAEHALRLGAEAVRWIGRPTEMPDSFPPSGRYDALISRPAEVRNCNVEFNDAIHTGRTADVTKLKDLMIPQDPRLTIALGCVSSIGRSATVVGWATFPVIELSASSQIVHPTGTPLAAPFDVLVTSSSSQNRESERVSAAHLLRSIPKIVSATGLAPISRNAMFVGLQVPDESLRVLGAASRNSFLVDRLATPCKEEHTYRSWHDSLCAQARMTNYAMGITVGATAIALANQYYSATDPDLCIQTALQLPADLLSRRMAMAEPFTDPADEYRTYPRAG